MRRAVLGVMVVLLGAATGCGGRADATSPEQQGKGEPVVLAERFEPASPAPQPSASPSAKPGPAQTTRPPRRPPPTRRPPTETVLPPAPPKPAPSGCVPTRRGTPATRAEVKAAINDAASRVYWPTSAPSIRIPANLIKAVAWQESGWQSDIVACDGGIGVMQVMPDTADFVNMRFGKSYDVNKYQDNVVLGANYLAWLVKYFGDVYFNGSYDLTVEDPDNPVLLDAVISAYNVGFGNVDTAEGLKIPNRQYVNNVEALMTSCPCLSF